MDHPAYRPRLPSRVVALMLSRRKFLAGVAAAAVAPVAMKLPAPTAFLGVDAGLEPSYTVFAQGIGYPDWKLLEVAFYEIQYDIADVFQVPHKYLGDVPCILVPYHGSVP